LSGLKFGTWEMTWGIISDSAVEEFFVVLSRAATVKLVDRGGSMERLPGDVSGNS